MKLAANGGGGERDRVTVAGTAPSKRFRLLAAHKGLAPVRTCVSDCDDSYSSAALVGVRGEGLVILQRKRMGRERVHMETPAARDN